MNDVPRTDAFGLNRNRRRNHPPRAVPAAEQRDMVNAIEQGNDSPHRIRILQRNERRLQLRGLHRNPKHVDGRNLRSDGDIHREIPERTFQLKLFGILRQRLAPHHQRDGISRVRQTSADQPSNAAGSENRMSHGFRHSTSL